MLSSCLYKRWRNGVFGDNDDIVVKVYECEILDEIQIVREEE